MDLSKLNEIQQRATTTIDGPVVVVAGAGSGKTNVLTHRVAYLIANGIAAHHILAITFTNKAAAEMKDRVEALIGPTPAWISTFHSMCVKILRRHCTLLGIDSTFNIIDDGDQQSIVRKIIKEYSIDVAISNKAIVAMVMKMKQGATYELPFNAQEALETIYSHYIAYCRHNHLLDFDDLLSKTLALFETQPLVLKQYQERFQFILVDEYQDTNDVQNQLVMHLGAVHQNIFLVGDEDQSIYRFRGANFHHIRDFEHQYPNTVIITLEQNYRSTQNILNAANGVIQHNHTKHPKRLWSARGDGDPIVYYRAITDGDETLFVASEIERLLMQGVLRDEIAVLYRANALSRRLEESLRQVNIPYVVYGGVGFFRRKEIKDVFAYLKLLIHPHDDWSLLRIINEPKRGIGPSTIEKMQQMASMQQQSLFEVCEQAEDHFNGKTATSLMGFAHVVHELQAALEDVTLVELLDLVLDQTGYGTMLHLSGDDGEFRLDNIMELKSSLSEYAYEGMSNNEVLALILEDLALYTDQEQASDDVVKLMTMHNAKGLEFKVVFLVALEEGIFPSHRSESEEDIEEERRLMYVALTRAKDQLYLSNASVRTQYGQNQMNPASRFLEEIDEALLERRGKTNYIQANTQVERVAPVIDPNAVYQLGDKVVHQVFGDGRVVGVDGAFVTVAFTVEHGIKKLIAGHPTLTKKEAA
jgi:DNA helicase-2/ATP-dependent DNA helicase PcrA